MIKKKSGFTLVELMVTVVIIAVISAGTYVGFQGFREAIVLEESAEIVQDILADLELEIVREEFKDITVYFEEDYLVIISEPENYTLDLQPSCSNEGVVANNIGELRKKNEDYSLISKNMAMGDEDCGDFLDSEDYKWEYQLFKSGDKSPSIRYVRYNVNWESTANLSMGAGDGSYMLIEGPYIAKSYYDSSDVMQTELTLTLTDGNNNEDIILK